MSASGEIKPKTYVNIGANAFGKITRLYVKEGDRVKKGQLLAQLENVQSSADVNATQAALEAARTDAVAAEAALNTSTADLNRAQSDYERAKLDWTRAQGLFKDALIAKSEYRQPESRISDGQAGLAQAQARVAQAKAQKDSADTPHHAEPGQPDARRRCVAKDDLRRALRRHDHQPSGARRRDGGDRHPEFTRQHADDDWPTCRSSPPKSRSTKPTSST